MPTCDIQPAGQANRAGITQGVCWRLWLRMVMTTTMLTTLTMAIRLVHEDDDEDDDVDADEGGPVHAC